jgi:hypothetical protein
MAAVADRDDVFSGIDTEAAQPSLNLLATLI